jgi:hypothetical protein
MFWGGLAGLILTAPLTALFYAGYGLAGFSFVPFSIFDWTTRLLPGQVITFGIETMVRIIRVLNLGATSATAKTAEQAMAIAGFLAGGIVFGGILFVILRSCERKRVLPIGLLAGGLLGVAALLIDRSVGFPAVNPVANAVWIIALFVAWGAAFGWAYRRLIPGEAAAEAPGASRPRLSRSGDAGGSRSSSRALPL